MTPAKVQDPAALAALARLLAPALAKVKADGRRLEDQQQPKKAAA